MTAGHRRLEVDDGAQLCLLVDSDASRETVGTIVFLHGWAMSDEYWKPQIRRLAPDYRIVAINFRSHGCSPPCRFGHNVTRYARDVHQVLTDCTEGERPWVVAWSMGATVLMKYIELFSDAGLRGAVFVDQTPRLLNDAGWNSGGVGLTRDSLEQTADLVRRDFPGFMKGFLAGMFRNPIKPRQLQHYLEIAASLHPEDAAALLVDHACLDARPTIQSLTVPALATSGGCYAAVHGAPAMAELSPLVQAVVFEEGGHCYFMEEATRFELVLRTFFASC